MQAKISRAYVTNFGMLCIGDKFCLEWYDNKQERYKRRFITTKEAVQDWTKTNTITARVLEIKTSLESYFALCRVDRDSLEYALTAFCGYCALYYNN